MEREDGETLQTNCIYHTPILSKEGICLTSYLISRVKGLRLDPECLGRERSDVTRRPIFDFFGRVVDDLSHATSTDESWILFRFRM